MMSLLLSYEVFSLLFDYLLLTDLFTLNQVCHSLNRLNGRSKILIKLRELTGFNPSCAYDWQEVLIWVRSLRCASNPLSWCEFERIWRFLHFSPTMSEIHRDNFLFALNWTNLVQTFPFSILERGITLISYERFVMFCLRKGMGWEIIEHTEHQLMGGWRRQLWTDSHITAGFTPTRFKRLPRRLTPSNRFNAVRVYQGVDGFQDPHLKIYAFLWQAYAFGEKHLSDYFWSLCIACHGLFTVDFALTIFYAPIAGACLGERFDLSLELIKGKHLLWYLAMTLLFRLASSFLIIEGFMRGSTHRFNYVHRINVLFLQLSPVIFLPHLVYLLSC